MNKAGAAESKNVNDLNHSNYLVLARNANSHFYVPLPDIYCFFLAARFLDKWLQEAPPSLN